MGFIPFVNGQSLPQEAKSSPHVSYFDDESGFESAKPPSDAVLDALLTCAEVKESAEDIEDRSRESLRSYFKAIPVDLGRSPDEVYVVTGTRLPMAAGDSDWFWIVRTGKKETRIILFYIGHTIRLARRATHGYKDVRATTGTPNQPEDDLFRYDGSMYRLFRRRLGK
jgi:hypothetical protein